MPLPTLTVPPYPFVPPYPGVPPLARAPADTQAPALVRQATGPGGAVTPLLAGMLSGAVPSFLNGVTLGLPQINTLLSPVAAVGDAVQPQSGTTGPQWGIFTQGGDLAITPDTVVSFEFSGSYRVISYPIEGGNFETYNKVQEPFEVRMVLRKSGTVSDRQAFIDTLDTIRASLDLYTAVSPEQAYDSLTITDVTYPRQADKGVTTIDATITLKQINVTASSSFTNTSNPTAQDPTNGGTVDATTPTPGQAAAVPPGGPS